MKRGLFAGFLCAFFVAYSSGVRAEDQVGTSKEYLPSNVGDLLAPGSRRYAPGIRMGSFILLPEAGASIVYDDNVFASPTNTESDLHTNVDAHIGLVSNWSRHALELYAGGGGNFYNEFDSENTSYANAGIAGRLDVQRDLYVKAFGRYNYGFEPRGSGESFRNFLEPVETETVEGAVLFHKHFNRLWIEAGGSVREEEFFDAKTALGTIDQSFRNGAAQEVTGRAGYDISPKTALFVEGSYDSRSYEDSRVDADGYKAGAGVRYELTRITSAEAAAGIRHYSPDQANFEEIDSWYGRAQLRWDLSPLMTVALVGSRDVGSPSQDGTGSNRINSEIGVRADYAIRRDVTLNAGAAYGAVEYVDSGRDDDYQRLAFGGEYLFRPALSLWADFSYLDYSSNATPVIDYDKSVVSAGVKARY